MDEFERCWQDDMRAEYGNFVGTKECTPAKPVGIDYAKFTIQEVGKSDKAVYGVRITLPGVDPRSIKVNLRNDNGNKKLSLTASLAVAKPTEVAAPVDEQADKAVKPAVSADKAVKAEATDAKDVAPVQPAKHDVAKVAAKKGKAECTQVSQQMYTYKMVNGRTREMTIKDGQITVTMDLPAVDISDTGKSFKDGVIAIDFNKEASVEEQTISFADDKDEK